MKSKRFKATMIVVVTVSAFAIWAYWTWSRACFKPTRLIHPCIYYLEAMPELFGYCFIPLGTSESGIVEKFGPPDETFHPNGDLVSQRRATTSKYYYGTEWKEHLKGRGGHASTVPPCAFTRRVLVYYLTSGVGAVVYYFIDDSGSLAAAFISEE